MQMKVLAHLVLATSLAGFALWGTPEAAWAQSSDYPGDNETSHSGDHSDSSSGSAGGGGGNIFKKYFGGGDSGTETKVTSPSDGPRIDEVQQEAYDGPKARIAVARFTDKTGTGWYHGGIGDGMADQLTTALFNSSRYIVLERQTLSDVLQEQDLGASGRVRQSTAAPIGEIEGAELLVTGAVTEFEGKAAGGSGGLAGSGWFGAARQLIGAVANSQSSAHMAIDVRIVDTRTSRIVAATSVEGTATDTNMGAALFGASGGVGLGGGISAWKNTPIEKALRQCIRAAVDFVVSKTPKAYYRHGTGMQQAAAAAAPAVATSTPQPAPAATQAPAPAPAVAKAEPARDVPEYVPGMVARVSSNRLNVRQGLGTAHAAVYSVKQGTPLLVLQRQSDWIQVRDQEQREGWTAAWLTFPDASVSPEMFEPAAVKAAGQSADPSDPIARLERLDRLFEQNLITEEEYNLLRRKILEDL